MVIGAGPNGLVAANLLADAGWDILVLEAQSAAGGAVSSDQGVAEGFIHDACSSFYPLGIASPVLNALRLHDFGLRWAHAPAVLGSPVPDGDWTLLYRDLDATVEGLERACPGDGDAWREMFTTWQKIGPALVRTLLSPFPPIRGGLSLLRRISKAGGLDTVRMLLQPSASLTGSRFGNEGARLLVSGNAAHADVHPHGAGSGLFGWLLAMLGQDVGFPAVEGGAQRLTDALVARLASAGGTVRYGTEVTRITIERGRATGVVVGDGERVVARRAVVADVSAPALYGRLVDPSQLPGRTLRAMSRFQWDPGTVKVDWALDGPVPWAVPPAAAPGTIHLSPSTDHLATTMNQIAAGRIPARPFLLIGQMTTADPTRSPTGTEALWAYTHVPQSVSGDAGAEGTSAITGSWDVDDARRMADRMQAEIARYAPGFASRIIGRRILSPVDLQARDQNLHGGAIGGGTSALHQQLIFRPIPGNGRPSTPIGHLYLGSASAHPGGGVHGACGANAARAALAAHRTPW